MSTAEALINGQRSHGDIRELVRTALAARIKAATGMSYVHVVDLTDTAVVYCGAGDDTWQCDYSVAGGGQVGLGFPVKVMPAFVPAPAAADPAPTGEADPTAAQPAAETVSDRLSGRVLEAKGKDDKGGRIYRVQILAYGDSKNGRRYPEAVMRSHAGLYDGARAYDHHRTAQEMQTSTISGLVGVYRSVQATTAGIEADLHLLPSATHAAEALDASLAAQGEGLAPLVGFSHDVYATFKTVTADGGRQVPEATAILKVNSADIVAEAAAGGQAVRTLAGGTQPPDPDGAQPEGHTKESDVTTSTADVLAALATATPEQLASVGLSKAAEATNPPAPPAPTPAPSAPAAGEAKGSFLARMMVSQKVAEAKLPEATIESITAALPDRITEADVDAHIVTIKTTMGTLERAGLVPTIGNVQVTTESHDKKVKALDAFFAGDYRAGYRSFKEAWMDFTGYRPQFLGAEDVNKRILRECFGGGFDSGMRTQESLDSSSWAQALGDSVTRRMMALYMQPSLQAWRKVCSEIGPVTDFRQQKRTRIGGYGTLPTVAQGAPYQPLQSPGDEEAVFSVIKRGGTEDLTIETVVNDDRQAVQRIPRLLGLAAAITLYRFVFDIFPTNAATTYDSTALFHANHNNTDNPALLGQTTLSTGRRKMRKQAAFGDTKNILSITPKFLIVPSDLEELAFQLTTSAVAITSAGDATIPNLHQGMEPIVVDYYTDANDWFLGCEPQLCPTIEVGFLGNEDPELFTQADQSSGTMFNADKMTIKIRHAYDGAVLDHRGFYRGANA